MAYDCLKKPLCEMNDDDCRMLNSYMNTWYVNNCAPWRDGRFSGWLEERHDIDAVVRAFMDEYHMQPEGFEEIRDLMLNMVEARQTVNRIHQWYADNCNIAKESPRFKLLEHDSLPDEVLDAMMQELNLPEDKRAQAGKTLWRSYRDDFEMWCS